MVRKVFLAIVGFSVVIFLSGFLWYWQVLTPSFGISHSDPEASVYKIDQDHLFLDWGSEIYVVSLNTKTVARPSLYGHHFLGIWIWPRGLDNYLGVRVGDTVKGHPGNFSFDGNRIFIEDPLQHKITLKIN